MNINKRTLRATVTFDADVELISGYLDELAGPEVSDRSLDNITKILTHIAAFPSSSSLHHSQTANIDNLRMFPVSRYPDYLLFYIDAPEEVVLVRLLHGMRDLTTELEALDTSE